MPPAGGRRSFGYVETRRTNAMKPSGTAHIFLDDRGRAWVDDTNTKVIEIVIDRVAYQWSPEAIQVQHPHLSLAQIHAALAYYYDHQATYDAELETQYQEYLTAWRAQQDSPLRQKLRAAGQIA